MTRRSVSQYDFEALEFDETLLKKHFTPLHSRDIEFVVVHHMTIVGKGDGAALTACYNTWQTREASAHYGVDGDMIRQFVWDKDFAWATGSNNGNLKGISIEQANSKAGPSWAVSSKTWKTGAKLAAYIHKVYKLGRPKSTGGGTGGTLRKHSAFYATSCPGPYIDSVWDEYVKEAQRVYDSITKKPSTPKPKPNPIDPNRDYLAVKTNYLNCAAYDTVGKGEKTRIQRIPEIADLLLSGGPMWIHTVEESSDMLSKMDKALPGYKRVAAGGKGRESRFKSGIGIDLLAMELSDVKHLLDGDTKPYLLTAWEMNGYRGLEVVFQNENQKSGNIQRQQMIDILSYTLKFADKWDVPWSNILVTGDTNLAQVVKDLPDWNWADVPTITPAPIRSEYKSLNGWKKPVKGDRIDVFAVRYNARTTRFVQTISTIVADHNRQFCERLLIK